MKKKKVLIVSYYWPPAGGVAVQRIVKTACYLEMLGWEPTVLTVDGGVYSVVDKSLQKEVGHIPRIEAKSIELQRLLTLLPSGSGKSKPGSSKPSKPSRWKKMIQFLLQLIRLNFFVPDSRVGWIKPATKEGLRWAQENKPDVILSTAPPYSVHFVAKEISETLDIPWVCDFRDPWLENLTYNVAPRLRSVKNKTARMERTILNAADAVTCTGWALRDLYLSKVSDANRQKFHVITNGYDIDNIDYEPQKQSKFVLSYIGTIYSTGLRSGAFDAIAELISSDPEFERSFVFRVVGNVENEAREMITSRIPAGNLDFAGFVSSSEVSEYLQEEQALLLLMYDVPFNECITLGKVFDYLKTHNPLLCVGPETGDTPRILSEFQENMLSLDNIGAIKGRLNELFGEWKAGTLTLKREVNPTFTRKHQAKQFAELFESLV